MLSQQRTPPPKPKGVPVEKTCAGHRSYKEQGELVDLGVERGFDSDGSS